MCKTKADRILWLIGIGMGEKNSMTLQAREILKQCDCIIGASRMIAGWKDSGIPCLEEYRPQAIREYLNRNRQFQKAAVLLSGDVGFYSGAKRLEEVFAGEEEAPEIIRVPGISSAVYLAAKLHLAWEDVRLVSMHGQAQNFVDVIRKHEKTFLLLGGKDSAQEVAEKFSMYGMDKIMVHIGKNLSYPEECIVTKPACEVTAQDLEGLCTALVINPEWDPRAARHIRDEEFLRGSVPMTKEEVRALCIAQLRLTRDAVLYDVGAGTGSVSVEAALQDGGIRVYAVEKNPEGIALIRENSRKFWADGVCAVEGCAPEALSGLPAPTHVFIGGSGGNIKDIIRCVKEKNPAVRIVITSISLDTMREVMEAVEEGILTEPEIVQIAAARSRKLGRHHMMTGQNPIYIISEG